jgi:hypothetical protein
MIYDVKYLTVDFFLWGMGEQQASYFYLNPYLRFFR